MKMVDWCIQIHYYFTWSCVILTVNWHHFLVIDACIISYLPASVDFFEFYQLSPIFRDILKNFRFQIEYFRTKT